MNPLHWSEGTWSLFFWAMALWNLVLSLPAVARPGLGLRLTFGFARDDSLSRAQQQLLSLGILVFGVGYAIIAVDPSEHTGLALLGIVGKVTIFGAFATLYAQGRATKIAFAAVCGDALWAALFVAFLFSDVLA